MRLVPVRYTLRSLLVRWSPSLFSALGIGLTVAVLGGVLALREGFRALLAETGRDDVVVFLRPGAQSEGESIVRHPLDSSILKTRPEIALDENNVPLAAVESYLGLKLPKAGDADAVAESSFVGRWNGTLSKEASAAGAAGASGAMRLRVTSDTSAEIDLPSRGVESKPLERFSRKGRDVHFEVAAADGRLVFDGRLDVDVLEGTCAEGASEGGRRSRFSLRGGNPPTTIVTVRGIEPASLRIQGKRWRIVPGQGRAPTFGAAEVVVGKPLVDRIRGCQLGGTLTFNVTPFKVVGVFACDGPYESEIWGDVETITKALQREFRQRLVAQIKPGTDVERLEKELEADKRVPVKVQTERAYFTSQTTRLGGVLAFLAGVLTTLMGAAAVLGAVNTMLAAVGARTREVGILVALGYRPFAVFLCFLLESGVIGLAGGALGAVLVLPFNGIQTSTTNWNTFTEIAFAFRVTPSILLFAIGVAVVLGLLGGALPAWRASRMRPTLALRRL